MDCPAARTARVFRGIQRRLPGTGFWMCAQKQHQTERHNSPQETFSNPPFELTPVGSGARISANSCRRDYVCSCAQSKNKPAGYRAFIVARIARAVTGVINETAFDNSDPP